MQKFPVYREWVAALIKFNSELVSTVVELQEKLMESADTSTSTVSESDRSSLKKRNPNFPCSIV